MGYLFIDQLLQDHDDVMREKKFDGELASFLIGKKKIYTFKSNNYMNECGKSIATFLNFFKIKSNLTYIIHDDLDITCLLYTSPSPRDPSISRMPSSA